MTQKPTTKTKSHTFDAYIPKCFGRSLRNVYLNEDFVDEGNRLAIFRKRGFKNEWRKRDWPLRKVTVTIEIQEGE